MAIEIKEYVGEGNITTSKEPSKKDSKKRNVKKRKGENKNEAVVRK